MKDRRIVVPVTEQEHDQVKEQAKKKGLDGIASYIRMLFRRDISGTKNKKEGE
jgi:hypothetical protein